MKFVIFLFTIIYSLLMYLLYCNQLIYIPMFVVSSFETKSVCSHAPVSQNIDNRITIQNLLRSRDFLLIRREMISRSESGNPFTGEFDSQNLLDMIALYNHAVNLFPNEPDTCFFVQYFLDSIVPQYYPELVNNLPAAGNLIKFSDHRKFLLNRYIQCGNEYVLFQQKIIPIIFFCSFFTIFSFYVLLNRLEKKYFYKNILQNSLNSIMSFIVFIGIFYTIIILVSIYFTLLGIYTPFVAPVFSNEYYEKDTFSISIILLLIISMCSLFASIKINKFLGSRVL